MWIPSPRTLSVLLGNSFPLSYSFLVMRTCMHQLCGIPWTRQYGLHDFKGSIMGDMNRSCFDHVLLWTAFLVKDTVRTNCDCTASKIVFCWDSPYVVVRVTLTEHISQLAQQGSRSLCKMTLRKCSVTVIRYNNTVNHEHFLWGKSNLQFQWEKVASPSGGGKLRPLSVGGR